jgi:hypothetical protein
LVKRRQRFGNFAGGHLMAIQLYQSTSVPTTQEWATSMRAKATCLLSGDAWPRSLLRSERAVIQVITVSVDVAVDLKTPPAFSLDVPLRRINIAR